MLDQLFEDYEYYRLFTTNYRRLQKQGIILKKAKKTKTRLEQLERMVDFCDENELDPRRYLHSLFAARYWNFAPKWEQLVPATEKTKTKAINRYHTETDISLYANRIQHNSQNVIPDTTFDPNRDIDRTVEGVKRRYLALMHTERCMGELHKTLGFHPRSNVCIRCPVARECERRLQALVPFDIIALRRGELTADQAKRIAGRYYASR